MRRLLLPFLVLVALLGCKKPRVEVEEDGPPLPIDPRGNAPGTAAPQGTAPGHASPGLVPGVEDPPPPEEPALSIAEACSLIDAHMGLMRRDIAGRRCFDIQPEGGGFRVRGYALPLTPAPAQTWESIPVCLWAKDDGTGYEFAYADTGSTCRTRDEYCRLGAPGARHDLNATACPGDDAQAPEPPETLARLLGQWKLVQGEGTMIISEDGHIDLKAEGVQVAGLLKLTKRGTGVVLAGDRSERVGFAWPDFRPDRLRFGLGSVSGTTNKEAFLAEPTDGRFIRRYGGACHEVAPGSKPVPCVLTDTATERLVRLDLGSHNTTYSFVGTAWLSEGVGRWEWERVATPPVEPLEAPAPVKKPPPSPSGPGRK